MLFMPVIDAYIQILWENLNYDVLIVMDGCNFSWVTKYHKIMRYFRPTFSETG